MLVRSVVKKFLPNDEPGDHFLQLFSGTVARRTVGVREANVMASKETPDV